MQEVEVRVKRMEDEMFEFVKELNKKVEQICVLDFVIEKYVKEVGEIKLQFVVIQVIVEVSVLLVVLVQFQCRLFFKYLYERIGLLKE